MKIGDVVDIWTGLNSEECYKGATLIRNGEAPAGMLCFLSNDGREHWISIVSPFEVIGPPPAAPKAKP